VAVATMSKSKSNQAPEQNPGAEDADKSSGKQTSLKVAQEDGQLVGKVARMRNISVEDLFRSRDVNDFFTHLLLEEMRLETERLKRKR
jgi:hypothetical protein